METRKKTTRRKLLKEFDSDSSITLLDAVRDSPTCRTPPVPIPGAPTALDGDDTKAARDKYEAVKEIVDAIYAKGRHRKWAKAISLETAISTTARKSPNWPRLSWPYNPRSIRQVWTLASLTSTTPTLGSNVS
ncbi:hypothetical protein CYMTET_46930 [Cymbomonas tetramitiformis]|uniref:Uncharacterized protein n=1 Tax=Cymbomonas tetramitiformis TaxID=36881 RepID=A0AAE0EX49_9CHLO|nr:hypothetical protein CYMTET_46930 [Cymbomonas tetramitiformis]